MEKKEEIVYRDINKFLEELKKYTEFVQEENSCRVKFTNDQSFEDVKEILNLIFDIETQPRTNEDSFLFYLDFKGCSVERLTEVFKLVLEQDEINDPLITLNLINLIKVANELDDTFFENPDIYVSDMEDLVDLRIDLADELEEFCKKISIYFISLFKSYNKHVFVPLDNHKPLPHLIKNIFESCDLLTISGIFSTSPSFSTEDLFYVDRAAEYIAEFMFKNTFCTALINEFLEFIDKELKREEKKPEEKK